MLEAEGLKEEGGVVEQEDEIRNEMANTVSELCNVSSIKELKKPKRKVSRDMLRN